MQLKGCDFVNVSDEQLNQMFRNESHKITAPPLHYRRDVSQLRHWFSCLPGKEERRLILEDADNYDIVISHFENPVWSETQGWIEWAEIEAVAKSLPSRKCRGVTTDVIRDTNWHGREREGMTPEEKQNKMLRGFKHSVRESGEKSIISFEGIVRCWNGVEGI